MVDRVELVDDDEAKQMALRLMREEGILCGISAERRWRRRYGWPNGRKCRARISS